MRIITLGFMAALAAAGAAAAATSTASLEKPIHQFIDGFDKGDMVAVAGAYAPGDITIVDEVAPYLWRGPDAVKAWAADLDKDIQTRGLSDASVTLGGVARAEVEGDKAYVIMRATYAYKQHGVAMHEPARMTYTLNKTADGWKITGWAWSGPYPTPVGAAAAPAKSAARAKP
jgi:ketosteroid isomerase-like protein